MIRPAIIDDRSRIYEIAAAHPDTEDFGAPWFSGEKQFTEGGIWVHETDGTIDGFMACRFRKKDDGVSLYFLGVAENGRGIGRRLLEHLKQMVRDSDRHTHVDLRCRMTNDRAMHFWLTAGFEVYGQDADVMLMKWVK